MGLLKAIFYTPLYNGLVGLIDLLPWLDIGFIIILFTLIIKAILFPLSYKAAKTQMLTKLHEDELNKIRADKNTPLEEQAKKILDFYRKYDINPFVGIIVVLIQIPIIFALYYMIARSGLPAIDTSLLYSFIGVPEAVKVSFLGIADVTGKSIILALLAAITTYIQARMMQPTVDLNFTGSFKDDLPKTMALQMRYVFPVIVFFISYSISGVIALYWATSNIVAISQDWYIKRKLKHGQEGNN
ncbi:MAG: hypothetical protein COV34_03530 [Candidatus Zambryskibacteria bacterium CG10_big_fil_rev_8_21_14_0_10_42_12]|uniref:Membrane insertase YidC/Oxa/ALB C-terminal domain-containing protein n=1 Tax=Candidatus Zambryskibacteria bacterium CG10_big_fil_rev_8_21_14_0_10_42_12 TaxID=1975115 RepID=A0A2H0QTL9_9BACT|nr:MAG: hypothetical protein COV34_03530 [Candidatus Zambryskibacteria bacterium CG10_big_fil_rev_8_21_14_0_10_42_12]